jgi:hypothetical protein
VGAFGERFQHVAQILRHLHFVGARGEIEQRAVDIEQQRDAGKIEGGNASGM